MSRHKRNKYQSVERIVELLETRRLFHDGVALHVAFGLPTTPIQEPYNKDVGNVYSAQDDGVLYGWAKDNTANVHERHDVAAPDLLHRGYAILPPADQNVWEIQVPNDDYQVTVVAGDAASTAGRYRIDVEGALTVDGTATAQNRWVQGTSIVSVNDGRLTVSSAPGATTNKIDYIDILAFDDPTTISVAAAPTSTTGAHDGAFTFTRIGSVSEAATYDYLVGGSAKSGRDYDPLDGEVTFPAGVASVTVPVTAESGLSGTKTVMVTLVPGETFLVNQVSATTTIAAKSVGATVQSAAFSTTRINFQPDGTPMPDYYKIDTGMTYGVRGNGMTYGWSADDRANTRDHNSPLSPDQRYDTLAHMQKNDANLSWQIAVPNGTYTVRVVAGDPDYTDSDYKINVEGVLTVNGVPTSANHWVEGTKTVTVKDGKLTISNATGSQNNKLDFVEIAPGSNALPVVSVSGSGQPAEGTASGKFTVTRTGSTSSALTVTYTLGGSAINGTDYDFLPGAVTIPAGSASADITIHPIDDTIAEGTENVTFNLSTASTYSNGQAETASRTIADNDVNTSELGKLKWTLVANSPVGRSEAETATIDEKVYVFGGFSDSSFSQGLRSDKYDSETNKWSRIADMPRAITHAGTAVVGTTVYFAGGYAQDPGGSSGGKKTFGIRDVWKYDTTNNTWSAGPPLPVARAAGGLVALGHSLYFFGGENLGRTKDTPDMYVLNLDNTAAGWSSLAPMPAARNHVGAVALNGNIYAIGGQTGFDNSSDFKNSAYRYNPSSNTWTTLPSLPYPESHIANSTIIYKGKIITLGGQGTGLVSLSNVFAYDPTNNNWTKLTPLPGARLSGAGGTIGDEIFFTSGYSGVFNNQTWIGTFG